MVLDNAKISIEEVSQYLSIAKSLKGSHYFYDMHVHPFEIVFTKGTYQENQQKAGLYSTGPTEFSTPQLTDIILESQEDKASASVMLQRPAIYRMKFSALYAHTGPEVFGAHMNLSTIDRILLLPVAPLEGSVNPQMDDIKKIFAGDERFYFGWSVSNDIKNEDIYKEACKAIKKFNVSSLKQNLTQTEINISTPEGKERLEFILDSCTKLNLSLILHSGRSPLAKNSEISRYGEIEVLEKFNWNSFACPIVFAHSAAYGCSAAEVKNQIIPRLKKMITKYPHLLIDISGVEIQGMINILEIIPIERILFGSDALYEPQWKRIVKLLYALEKSAVNLEESFIKIMSHNPENQIFVNRILDN